MGDLYYLDQYREAVAEAEIADKVKAVVNTKKVDAAEELMQEAKVSMKIMSERTAKLMLDLAFNKITHMSDDLASERLIRYAGELHCKAKFDLDERQEFFATLEDHIEDHIGDD